MRAHNAGRSAAMRALQPSSIRLRRIRVNSIPACGPTGSVYRQEDGLPWLDCGRLGEELEVMGMMVYNGKLYAGTLPTGSVYRYDGEGRVGVHRSTRHHAGCQVTVAPGPWQCTRAASSAARCRRATCCRWRQAENVTHDHALPGGWHHLAAARADGVLRLYVDGILAGSNVRVVQRRRLRPINRGTAAHRFRRHRPLQRQPGRCPAVQPRAQRCGDFSGFRKTAPVSEYSHLASTTCFDLTRLNSYLLGRLSLFSWADSMAEVTVKPNHATASRCEWEFTSEK